MHCVSEATPTPQSSLTLGSMSSISQATGIASQSVNNHRDLETNAVVPLGIIQNIFGRMPVLTLVPEQCFY